MEEADVGFARQVVTASTDTLLLRLLMLVLRLDAAAALARECCVSSLDSGLAERGRVEVAARPESVEEQQGNRHYAELAVCRISASPRRVLVHELARV